MPVLFNADSDFLFISSVNQRWCDVYVPRLNDYLYSHSNLKPLGNRKWTGRGRHSISSILTIPVPENINFSGHFCDIYSDRMKHRILRSLNMKIRKDILEYHEDAFRSNGFHISMSISDIVIKRAPSVSFCWLCSVDVEFCYN